MHDFCRSLLVSLALWQSASAFHKYSSAWENTPSEIPFTGVNEVRNDVSISGIPNDGCSTPITGTPVYQPEWVVQTSNSDTWTELGTGHQCGDTFRYWYWLEGAPGLPNGYLLGVAIGGWRCPSSLLPVSIDRLHLARQHRLYTGRIIRLLQLRSAGGSGYGKLRSGRSRAVAPRVLSPVLVKLRPVRQLERARLFTSASRPVDT
jgi:hypothetical protein